MIDPYLKKQLEDAIHKIETIIQALGCMNQLIEHLDERLKALETKPKPRSRKQA